MQNQSETKQNPQNTAEFVSFWPTSPGHGIFLGMSLVNSVELYCRTLGFTFLVPVADHSWLGTLQTSVHFPVSVGSQSTYTKLFSLCVCCYNLHDSRCASTLIQLEKTVSSCDQSSLALNNFPTSFFFHSPLGHDERGLMKIHNLGLSDTGCLDG